MESEIGTNESVSTAVVRAVSAVDGRHPRALQPLADVVDPDALDALFDPRSNGEPRTGGRLSFVFGSCRVTVDNGEYLTLQPIGDRKRASRPLDHDDRGPTDRGSNGNGQPRRTNR